MGTEPFVEKLSFLDKVNEWKREHYGENCQDASISRVVAHFKEIWDKKKALENQIKEECNIALQALSEIGVSIMEDENIDSANVNGEPIWIKDKTYFSRPGKKDSAERLENERIFRIWMEEHELLECYITTLPHKRFESICKEELKEGRPLPDGVKMTPWRALCVNRREAGKAEREEED